MTYANGGTNYEHDFKKPVQVCAGYECIAATESTFAGNGKKLLILISESGTRRIGPLLEQCFAGTDYTIRYEIFRGECSQSQIDRLAEIAKAEASTAVVGIGGGKS